MKCNYSPCGQQFQPKKPWQKFCSDECRMQEWQHKQEAPLKERIVELTQIVRHVCTCANPLTCQDPLHVQAAQISEEKEVMAVSQ